MHSLWWASHQFLDITLDVLHTQVENDKWADTLGGWDFFPMLLGREIQLIHRYLSSTNRLALTADAHLICEEDGQSALFNPHRLLLHFSNICGPGE